MLDTSKFVDNDKIYFSMRMSNVFAYYLSLALLSFFRKHIIQMNFQRNVPVLPLMLARRYKLLIKFYDYNNYRRERNNSITDFSPEYMQFFWFAYSLKVKYTSVIFYQLLLSYKQSTSTSKNSVSLDESLCSCVRCKRFTNEIRINR